MPKSEDNHAFNDPDNDMLDVDLVSSQPTESSDSPPSATLTDANTRVLAYIDDVFAQVLRALSNSQLEESTPEIVPERNVSSACQPENSSDQKLGMTDLDDSGTMLRSIRYRWPGRTEREAWHFGKR